MSDDCAVPFISLIASTLGRDEEVTLLLETLAAQNDDHFELIVVDQNPDDRLVPVIQAFEGQLPIRHVRTTLRGLDRGRNLGASHARGDWFVFPDDDSWYPPDFLKRLRHLIATENADIYSGRSLNRDGAEIMVRFLQEDAEITRANVWQVLIEWVIAFRATTFRAASGFDEHLGVGSGTAWNSGEGQDLVLRCLANGARGLFRRELWGYHPEHKDSKTTDTEYRKMRSYGVGYGFVMHRHGFTKADMLPSIIRPIVGMAVYTMTGRIGMARRSRHILEGRLEGWRSWQGQPVVSEQLSKGILHAE
jgi:glycosyltransferase involved in cell wall biosynthesis